LFFKGENMRVKMLVTLVGHSFAVEPGCEHICSDAEAARLIVAGFAVPVSEITLERAVKVKVRGEVR
jgi:hypothetical protein